MINHFLSQENILRMMAQHLVVSKNISFFRYLVISFKHIQSADLHIISITLFIVGFLFFFSLYNILGFNSTNLK